MNAVPRVANPLSRQRGAGRAASNPVPGRRAAGGVCGPRCWATWCKFTPGSRVAAALLVGRGVRRAALSGEGLAWPGSDRHPVPAQPLGRTRVSGAPLPRTSASPPRVLGTRANLLPSGCHPADRQPRACRWSLPWAVARLPVAGSGPPRRAPAALPLPPAWRGGTKRAAVSAEAGAGNPFIGRPPCAWLARAGIPEAVTRTRARGQGPGARGAGGRRGGGRSRWRRPSLRRPCPSGSP